MRVPFAELGSILGRTPVTREPNVRPTFSPQERAGYISLKQTEPGRRSSVDRSIRVSSEILYENPLRNIADKATQPIATVVYKAQQWWHQSGF